MPSVNYRLDFDGQQQRIDLAQDSVLVGSAAFHFGDETMCPDYPHRVSKGNRKTLQALRKEATGVLEVRPIIRIPGRSYGDGNPAAAQ